MAVCWFRLLSSTINSSDVVPPCLRWSCTTVVVFLCWWMFCNLSFRYMGIGLSAQGVNMNRLPGKSTVSAIVGSSDCVLLSRRNVWVGGNFNYLITSVLFIQAARDGRKINLEMSFGSVRFPLRFTKKSRATTNQSLV